MESAAADLASPTAVRWRVFDQTVAETKARNAAVPADEIDSAIDEALEAYVLNASALGADEDRSRYQHPL